MAVKGKGTKESPWQLKTPPGTSAYTMYKDESADPPVIVCQVGSTKLGYLWRGVDDLHAMLKKHGDWMELGSADENKPAKEGTVEAWARSPKNPVKGWYGTKKGCAAALACTCRRCSKLWGWPKSSTTPKATACEPSRKNGAA